MLCACKFCGPRRGIYKLVCHICFNRVYINMGVLAFMLRIDDSPDDSGYRRESMSFVS